MWKSALNWIWSLWNGSRRRRLLLVGLDNSGKSTFGHLLQRNHLVSAEPTVHPLKHHFTIAKTEFETLDLGGHKESIRLWKSYYRAALDGIIFMVDAAAPERFPEAAKQLSEILTADFVTPIPIAVLGNKIDAKGAVSDQKLMESLNLQQQMDVSEKQRVRLFMISVVKRCNCTEPFVWLKNNFV